MVGGKNFSLTFLPPLTRPIPEASSQRVFEEGGVHVLFKLLASGNPTVKLGAVSTLAGLSKYSELPSQSTSFFLFTHFGKQSSFAR